MPLEPMGRGADGGDEADEAEGTARADKNNEADGFDTADGANEAARTDGKNRQGRWGP